MPTGAYITDSSHSDATGDATGARTARAADDTIGVLETNSVVTATANQLAQNWGHRRFVSAPLAATTFAAADGNWLVSTAVQESNTNHAGNLWVAISLWRPGSGARVGTVSVQCGVGIVSTTKSFTGVFGAAWSGTQAILDGDVLVFEVTDNFTQTMSVAYTSTFYYDGTTEASTTSNAAFVTPPAALTLFTASTTTAPIRVIDQAVNRSSVY